MATIDHLILNVNDIDASVDFYVNVLGFKNEGEDGPFTVIRISDDFTLQLAPWGTKGNEHYAFALPRALAGHQRAPDDLHRGGSSVVIVSDARP